MTSRVGRWGLGLMLLWATLLAFFLLSGGIVSAPGAKAAVAQRPNILLLVADDQTQAMFSRALMPTVFSQLVDQGVNFRRFYVNTSQCCPSRAEILTGLDEQHTGVDWNTVLLTRPTIAQALHDVGYRTALSGKYLNSETACPPHPEFDLWVCQSHVAPSSYSLQNPTLNVNGVWTHFTGLAPEIEADYLINFMNATPADQPFFAMYTPVEPHLPANDPRYATLPVAPHRPPNFNEETRTDGKPAYMQRGPLTTSEIAQDDNRFRNMTRASRGLDDSVARILNALGTRSANTLVIYVSDNGILLGEHRRVAKQVPYEEAVNTPFVVRYPPWRTSPSTSQALVSNIDIAPTIADAVGIQWNADGLSLRPLLTGSATTIRDALLINHCEGDGKCANYKTIVDLESQPSPPAYFGIVTSNYKYIDYRSGEKELYDLVNDPYELTNRASDPTWSGTLNNLEARLAQLLVPPLTDTTIVTGPSGVAHTRAFTFRYFSQSRFATYACRLDKDGVPGNWSACNGQALVVGPLSDGDYQFLVRGTDENGVTDPTPASRAFSIHSVGPGVRLDSTPPNHLRGRSVAFMFSSTTGGATFECRSWLWDTPPPAWAACDPTVGASYAGLTDGSWAFEVRATDSNHQTSDPPAMWLFQIDNVGPVMTFTKKPAASTTATSATFQFQANEPTSGSLSCRLDNGPITDCSSGTVTLRNLTRTGHTFTVTATDVVGNAAATSYSWTIH